MVCSRVVLMNGGCDTPANNGYLERLSQDTSFLDFINVIMGLSYLQEISWENASLSCQDIHAFKDHEDLPLLEWSHTDFLSVMAIFQPNSTMQHFRVKSLIQSFSPKYTVFSLFTLRRKYEIRSL